MKTRGRSKSHLNVPYTTRDTHILWATFVLRYMTTPQIRTLYFPNASMLVCNQRLKKLVDYGLLRTIEQAIKRGEGRKPYIYALTELGGVLLSYERGVDPKLINVTPWADEGNNLKLKHILATTDLLIAVHEACKTGEFSLEAWETEREIRSQLTKETVRFVGLDGQKYRTPLPDLIITLGQEGKRALCWVEVDRATESIALSSFEKQSIEAKVREYLAYEQSPAFRTRYGSRPLRVLFVTTGIRRLGNMKNAAERVISQMLDAQTDLSDNTKRAECIRLGKRFRFITAADVDPETILTGAVWAVAGQDTLRAMVE